MDPTRAYDDEFFGPAPAKADAPAAGHAPLLARKSTVAISLVVIGSALFLARGCWYYQNDDRNRPYRSGGLGGGRFFFTGGGSGYPGGSKAPSVGGSARGGFGATGVHSVGVG
ncbi:MAG: hypothetical protein P4L84_07290 [Isosphaeraceae bacterium]|nr:hypothetical protein [Isosphaeraceae bacterium]